MKFLFGALLLVFCIGVSAQAQTRPATGGKPHPLKDSVDKYRMLVQYEKAVPFAGQLIAELKKQKKEETAEYAAALDAWGDALDATGKSAEAEPVLLQALDLRKRILGEEDPEVATTMHHLAILFMNQGDYAAAETYYLQCLEIRRKNLGENHVYVAKTRFGLGTLYRNMGDFAKAETWYLVAYEYFKVHPGDNEMELILALKHLGRLNHDLGNYPKAEDFYLQTLQAIKRHGDDSHPDKASTLSNLGNLYYEMGIYAKAEPICLQALDVQKKNFGPDHPHYPIMLLHLGNLYYGMSIYPKAEKYYIETLAIWEKTLGENHPYLASPIGNLAALYNQASLYRKAETYYEKALTIYRNNHEDRHPNVALWYQNLGQLQTERGDYGKAEESFRQSIEMQKALLGENHPDLAKTNFDLANTYRSAGKMDLAEVRFKDWNTRNRINIQRYFPFLSDEEKEAYYGNSIAPVQEQFKSFCVQRYPANASIAGDMYDDQLATKGLMLSSSAKWRHRIRTSGDTSLVALFQQWEDSRSRLNRCLQSTDSTERSGIDTLMAETEKLEKALSLRSEAFANLAEKKLANWKQVQKRLKPGEAAVEMVRIMKFGIGKMVTDTSDPKKPTYLVKGLTDTIQYAALLVKPTSLYPELVLLNNGNELEGKYLNFYQNAIKSRSRDTKSYQQFWEKIGEKLKPFHRIYFSPDGVFHQINLNTLQNPKTNKTLLDEKEIHFLTSTKDLLPTGEKANNNKLAYLFGFPNFEAPFEKAKDLVATREQKRGVELSYVLKLNPAGISLTSLPGTQVEVERISDILSRNQWEVHALMRDKALEETLKESNRPRLLHIATHGYFQNDSSRQSNPLLRSGLFLSRSAQTLNGKNPNASEDGILTAYEAMNLNLDNTDLVVLSACETGLGEIKNGEGVYGLQRAFKVAGAKSIIMSLWKVDDEATQELMVSFYKHWVAPPNPPRGGGLKAPFRGLGAKRSAFLAAQKELKAKYPNPYYWGAFVMVGE